MKMKAKKLPEKVKLSEKQFFQELMYYAKKHKFENNYGEIRSLEGEYCPIASVIKSLQNKKKLAVIKDGNGFIVGPNNNDAFQEGQDYLGLKKKFCEDIIEVADEEPSNDDYQDKIDELHDIANSLRGEGMKVSIKISDPKTNTKMELRKRLEKACGLG